MRKKDFLIVLPKVGAYEYKDITVQLYIDSVLKEWISLITEHGYNVVFIHEDMLALKLAGDAGYRRYSVLTMVGRRVLSRFETTPDSYSIYTDVVEDSRVATKATEAVPADINPGKTTSEILRDVIPMRVKRGCELLLDDASNVLYIDANNNFCKKPEPRIGDGRIVCILNTMNDTYEYYFGGTRISKEMLLQVLEVNR